MPRLFDRFDLFDSSTSSTFRPVLTWTTLHLIAEWAIRLVMLVYVPQRRSPAAARSWLLLIFIFPYGGLLLYWIFGRPYLPKRRIEIQPRASEFARTNGQEVFL